MDVHLAELDKLTLQPPLDLFFGSLSPTLAMYLIFHGHTGVTEKGISNDTKTKLAVSMEKMMRHFLGFDFAFLSLPHNVHVN